LLDGWFAGDNLNGWKAISELTVQISYIAHSNRTSEIGQYSISKVQKRI